MTCSATSTATAKSSDLSQRISGSSSTELHYLGAGASHEFGPVRQWGPALGEQIGPCIRLLDFRSHAGGRDALLADVQVDLVPGPLKVKLRELGYKPNDIIEFDEGKARARALQQAIGELKDPAAREAVGFLVDENEALKRRLAHMEGEFRGLENALLKKLEERASD